ncbi:MAG: hypothetical protein A2075_09615 [Geobacteraceae bacterium GWC2_58_44]|nr:MAG: hypothetical protein A2075_09615 [Geobacteraceae bacterium GWC2_58_44]HBG05684.1 hypothetical protein [Geobacter sp.]
MAERVKAQDEKFCHECGEVIRARAEICPKCGVRQPMMKGIETIAGNILGQGEPRSRVLAGVLAILLGTFGLHKFYLGQPGWGIAYLLLCWTFIPAIVGLIEGLLYLTMSDEGFQTRYSGPAWSKR